ncbi:MAG: alpha-hydroxy-acid oxidizing protein, partial [Bartonella sp.]|nr:alpha-hydroxy-acid oxidizing protein [Bartonella sp.]
MIISSTVDYREAAKCRLPSFLFHYIDGGAYAEETMRRNCTDLQELALRQRILKQVGEVDLSTEILGQKLGMPIVLAPVGLTGMYARRGEVKATRAAVAKGIPFTLSSVSVCSISEIHAAVGKE